VQDLLLRALLVLCIECDGVVQGLHGLLKEHTNLPDPCDG
jgi:hypothetical protein